MVQIFAVQFSLICRVGKSLTEIDFSVIRKKYMKIFYSVLFLSTMSFIYRKFTILQMLFNYVKTFQDFTVAILKKNQMIGQFGKM